MILNHLLTILLLFLLLPAKSFSWEYNARANAQYSSTDNVNATNTSKISDTYNTYNVLAQIKNGTFKLKLKGKIEKYKNETANDYYSTEGSLQYKRSQNDDYTVAAYNTTYNNLPAAINDFSSDNNGLKFSANFNTQYNERSSSFLTLSENLRNYPKQNRADKTSTATLGIEYIHKTIFTISPDFTFTLNSSNNYYYKNYSYGPSIYLSLIPDIKWEHFISSSYTYTNYSERTVSTIVRGRTIQNREHQTLITFDIGSLYYLTSMLSLQAKFSTSQSKSNNSASVYKINIMSVNIGIKF